MSAHDQAIKNAILNHYLAQSGRGNYPVFRGAPVQYGNGIGDIFRSIGRFLMPIFASSARTFLSTAAQGLTEGQTLKEATKRAIKPTLTKAVEGTTDQVMSKFSGQGRRRRRRAGKRRTAKKRVIAARSRVYKGAGKKRKGKRKFPKFIASNF